MHLRHGFLFERLPPLWQYTGRKQRRKHPARFSHKRRWVTLTNTPCNKTGRNPLSGSRQCAASRKQTIGVSTAMSDLKIFTQNIDPKALCQIHTLIQQPAFSQCKIRIMPDVHAGAGCVIGFTADLGDKVIPNIVGVDIGCGILTVDLGKMDIDFAALDNAIRARIPSGRNLHVAPCPKFAELPQLRCFSKLKNLDRLEQSLGTLGGGNHFIEIDADTDGTKYLVIHSGSRNLGKQVAEIYQQLAVELMQGKDNLAEAKKTRIAEYKKQGREKEIQKALEELDKNFHPHPPGIPKELCYLTGRHREDYLHDMELCQKFASQNRWQMATAILTEMRWPEVDSFETVHNYIEFGSNIVRKGAISAKAGEKLLIPINMRDGCIMGVGKGNEDWNCSAPHGAGRIMSRREAKAAVSLKEFEESMHGIFTTSVSQSTIDESPMVYKPMDEIAANITDTVDILKVITPIYNFKAGE